MKQFSRRTYQVLKFLVPVFILLLGLAGGWKLMSSRERAKRSDRPVTAKYVEVVPIAAVSRPIVVSGFGTVRAHRELTVQAQVQGVVVAQHPRLNQGAILEEGELLVGIDRSDYEAALTAERAALANARFNLKVEEGRQVIAKREWDLLDDSVERTPLSAELALRKPHLEEKQAAVEAAESRVRRAERDLARTEIAVPFHAMVTTESIEVGQLVTAQSTLARLIGIDAFHIEVSLGVDDLPWVRLPDATSTDPARRVGSTVRVSQDVGMGKRLEREGVVVGLLGEVDPVGRMARILVEVTDPLGVHGAEANGESSGSEFPLLVGEYVRVEIDGPTLEEVVAIPRTGMREGSTVWVMDRESKLQVRPVERIFSTRGEVIAKNTFEPGDAVITSALQVPLPGLLLTTSVAAPTSETPPGATPQNAAPKSVGDSR